MRHDDGSISPGPGGGRLSEQHPIQSWKQEYQDLRYWQKTLTEYEEALESLKRL